MTAPAVRLVSINLLAWRCPGSDLLVADYSNHVIRKGTPALPDVPVVDVPVGLVSTVRQLDVTNLTTVSWLWTIIRRPADSSAQISSSTARNPTFTPDVPDLYVVRFEGTNSSGRFAIGTLNLDSIATQPQIRSIAMADEQCCHPWRRWHARGNFFSADGYQRRLAVGRWTELPGGIFDGSGRFGFTNGASPGVPVQVYLIRVP